MAVYSWHWSACDVEYTKIGLGN